MSSTALAATVFVNGPAAAAEVRRPDAAAKPPAPATTPLSGKTQEAIRQAARRSKRELIAGLFDAAWQEPAQRKAALAYATSLAPGFVRELTTAADLGALLSGQKLALAPNAASIVGARSGFSSSAAPPSMSSPRANNTTTTMPTPTPTTNQQIWNREIIAADAAYTRGYTGSGVSVAVADTGFSYANAALANRLDLTRAKNYVLNSPGISYDPTYVDQQSNADYHGSHVAGIIAAEKFDNIDMHGVAHNARVIPIRLLAEQGAVNAPQVADPFHDALIYFAGFSNVMVYNASYGPSVPDTPALSVWPVGASTTEYDAALTVAKAGKIIVAAAGNERNEHPIAGRNPSGLALMPFLSPDNAGAGVYTDDGANHDFTALQHQNGLIIGVMAVGSNKEAAAYSNFCGVTASWCVAAPGGNDPTSLDVLSAGASDTYRFAGGTSMAAPHVSGAIALLIEAYPGYNAQDLAHVLFSTTEDLGNAGVDSLFGHGLIRLDRATDGPTTLAAAASINVAANTTTYWSQPLTTAGAFTKTGDGILTIAGRTSAAGDVNVALGTLAVDGTLTVAGPNTLNVNTNGTLAGFGTVNGNTVVNGNLSPGQMPNIADLIANGVYAPGTTLNTNSIGILTFNGNVTLSAGAITQIDIDGNLNTLGGPRTFDRIIVSGAGHVFTANGMLIPGLRDSIATVSNYTPAIGTNFAFVQATNGATTTGAFAQMVQPVSGLPANGRFDLIYSQTAITLAVTPASFAALSGGNAGSPANTVAGIIDANRPAAGLLPSANSKALYDALYAIESPAQYNTLLTQLSGPGQPAVTSASMAGFQGFMGSIGERQDALLTGAQVAQDGTAQSIAFGYAKNDVSAVSKQASAAFASVDAGAAASPAASSVWAQGFGRWSNVGDAGGLSGSSSRSGGFTIGADTLLAPNLIGGMAFGFARTTSSSASTRSTADSFTGALYASWTPGAAVYDLRIAAGPTQIRTTRNVDLAPSPVQGDASGFGGGVSFEAGYRIPVAGFTAKPYAGIAWQAFRRNAYTESQQPFGLAFPSQYFEKITTTLGVAISRTFVTDKNVALLPEFKLGWSHDLRDTSLVSQAALLDSAFTTNGAAPGRDAAVVGVKLSGWTQSNFRLFTAYTGEFRKNAASHQLSGGARYTW